MDGIDRRVARLFGIDMAENFRRPIFATSLTDYWRRWHITLGAWMRDYVPAQADKWLDEKHRSQLKLTSEDV